MHPISLERQRQAAERRAFKDDLLFRRRLKKQAKRLPAPIPEDELCEMDRRLLSEARRAEAESFRDTRAWLFRSGLLEGLGEDEVAEIEDTIWQLARGELKSGEWRELTRALRERRRWLYPAPRHERRYEPPRGW